MALSSPSDTETRTVTLTIDGREVTVPEGTTIWTAAHDAGIEIPVLCHDERYDPVGVCRVCAVDVGGRVLAAACVRPCEDGMEVKTATEEVERQRAMLTSRPRTGTPRRRRRPTTSCWSWCVATAWSRATACPAAAAAARTSPIR